ncbi:MAG: Protein GrpE [Nitrosopumilus sp.]|nr:Protein GrpE [Nitrosopumilus sp.]
MSSEFDSDEIPIDVISDEQDEKNLDQLTNNNTTEEKMDDEEQKLSQTNIEELTKLLDLEKQKVIKSDEKFKHVLADFQNLSRKTQSDIEHGVNTKVDEFILDFLKIYDDFVRAKEVFSENKINIDGLDSILKNMDSLLKKYQVVPIDALGEIFDPNSHEAISIITDPDLDDNTITKEIRKGYMSQNRIIRATLVEISKQA